MSGQDGPVLGKMQQGCYQNATSKLAGVRKNSRTFENTTALVCVFFVFFLGIYICRSPVSLVTWKNNGVRGLFLYLKCGEPPHCNKVVKLL